MNELLLIKAKPPTQWLPLNYCRVLQARCLGGPIWLLQTSDLLGTQAGLEEPDADPLMVAYDNTDKVDSVYLCWQNQWWRPLRAQEYETLVKSIQCLSKD